MSKLTAVQNGQLFFLECQKEKAKSHISFIGQCHTCNEETHAEYPMQVANFVRNHAGHDTWVSKDSSSGGVVH